MPRGHKVLVYLAISILSDNIPTFGKAQRGTEQKTGHISTSVSIFRTYFCSAHLPHCSLLACCPDPWLFCTIRNQLHSAINCLLQNPFSHKWHHLLLLGGLFPLKYIICRRWFRQSVGLASWSRWCCRFFRNNWILSRLQASRSRGWNFRLWLKQLVGNDPASVSHFWTLLTLSSAIFFNLEDNDLIFYCILWQGQTRNIRARVMNCTKAIGNSIISTNKQTVSFKI